MENSAQRLPLDFPCPLDSRQGKSCLCMKALTAILSTFLGGLGSRRNLRTLLRLVGLLAVIITIFSVLFHVLMEREGQRHSWMTGIYWTFTVMTTLGFGDITFKGDIGRFFSIVVMGTGVLFMLVIMPFAFIQFFYAPWMDAQAKARAPRELPPGTRRHVILTNHDPVTVSLIPLLERYGHPYVILLPALADALELHDRGIKVAVGETDDPETFRRMRLENAAMLVANRNDTTNTNMVFTAREYAPRATIVATASNNAALDMLELAGATVVMRPHDTMARALARRVLGHDRNAHVIGQVRDLLIAEATVAGAEFAGKSLAESGIREKTGFSLIGYWDHGKLVAAGPETILDDRTVLIGAGTREQVDSYNQTFGGGLDKGCHVVIVGGGRVGRLTASLLSEAGHDPVVVEKLAERVSGIPNAVVGDITHVETLRAARAREAPTIILTSHDDDANIALTIFFNRLRAQTQIIARCSHDRNARTLHRAGADLVLSSASMGANTILNLLRATDHLLLAEGVTVFPSPVPDKLAGRRIADAAVRSKTGCTIIAVEHHGSRTVNPGPDHALPAGGTLWLVGTLEGEEAYLRQFKPELAPQALRRRWKKQDARRR